MIIDPTEPESLAECVNDLSIDQKTLTEESNSSKGISIGRNSDSSNHDASFAKLRSRSTHWLAGA